MLTNTLPIGSACVAQAARTEKALDQVLTAIDKTLEAQKSYMAKLDEMIAKLKA